MVSPTRRRALSFPTLPAFRLFEPPCLLRNHVTGNHHWTKVKLRGVQSNRSAIGARVTVRYGERVRA
jgi:hypothetical protein